MTDKITDYESALDLFDGDIERANQQIKKSSPPNSCRGFAVCAEDNVTSASFVGENGEIKKVLDIFKVESTPENGADCLEYVSYDANGGRKAVFNFNCAQGNTARAVSMVRDAIADFSGIRLG